MLAALTLLALFSASALVVGVLVALRALDMLEGR